MIIYSQFQIVDLIPDLKILMIKILFQVEKIKYEKKKVDEKEQFVCGECGKMFSRSGFYSHMRHVHEGIERIKYDKVSFNLRLDIAVTS